MFSPLILPFLLPLLTTATPAPTTHGTNNPSAPLYFQGTNQTLSAWTRAGCGTNSDGNNTDNIFFPNVLYGKDNHALVVSFMLGRDMRDDEQLDMSFFEDPKGDVGSTGIDKECALFQYTASPMNGGVLKANVCYEPPVAVTCVNLWRVEA